MSAKKKTRKVTFDFDFAKHLTRGNIAILIAAVLVGLIYFFRGFFIAAQVNGTPISRFSVISQLERQQGATALDALISELLIKQAAESQGVSISDEELNARIAELEESLAPQGISLEEALEIQGLTREDLNNQLQIQLLVEKLLQGQINLDDAEIDEYLEQNADFLGEGLSDEEKRQQAVDALEQQKLAQNFQIYLDGLRTDADIRYFVNY